MVRSAVLTAFSLWALAASQEACTPGADCPNDDIGNVNLLQSGYAMKQKEVSRHTHGNSTGYDPCPENKHECWTAGVQTCLDMTDACPYECPEDSLWPHQCPPTEMCQAGQYTYPAMAGACVANESECAFYPPMPCCDWDTEQYCWDDGSSQGFCQPMDKECPAYEHDEHRHDDPCDEQCQFGKCYADCDQDGACHCGDEQCIEKEDCVQGCAEWAQQAGCKECFECHEAHYNGASAPGNMPPANNALGNVPPAPPGNEDFHEDSECKDVCGYCEPKCETDDACTCKRPYCFEDEQCKKDCEDWVVYNGCQDCLACHENHGYHNGYHSPPIYYPPMNSPPAGNMGYHSPPPAGSDNSMYMPPMGSPPAGMPPAADDAGGFSNSCVAGALDPKFLDMEQCTCHHSCWQTHRQGDANMDKGTEDAAYSLCKAACDDSACLRDNQLAGQGCMWCTVGEYCGSTGGNMGSQSPPPAGSYTLAQAEAHAKHRAAAKRHQEFLKKRAARASDKRLKKRGFFSGPDGLRR